MFMYQQPNMTNQNFMNTNSGLYGNSMPQSQNGINPTLFNNFVNAFGQNMPGRTPEDVARQLMNSGKYSQDVINQAIQFANNNINRI